MSMATIRTADSFDHWWDPEGRKRIILYRRSIRASTERYVKQVPFIDGASEGLLSEHPAIPMLAEAYRGLVKGELAHHSGDPAHAMWTGVLFGPLFAQIWETASALKLKSLQPPAGVRAFAGGDPKKQAEEAQWLLDFIKSLPDYKIEDWIAQETYDTADILSQAYVKAFIELAASTDATDRIVIRHHAAVLGEIISDMLNLVMQGGERTDLRLPPDHLHKKISVQQEKLRAPYAAKPWF